jgi:diguanylate cyclase (GGDEF)-like protein
MATSNNQRLEEWLDSIVQTLKDLDETAKCVFIQESLLGLVGLEISEKERVAHWEGVLSHHRQLTEKLSRSVTLRTAAVDYFGELSILQNPILMEYEELRRLRHSAATDPLTGLNNRRIFEEDLRREINRSSRYSTPFALLSIDLRRFKRVNDTYGHATGDEILRCVARASLETIRASDVACRVGGDEFAILLPRAQRSNAEMLAERIARKFEEYAGTIAPETTVGIDYGIAIFPQDGQDSSSLFAVADKTLYTRKHRAHKLAARGIHPRASLSYPSAEPTAGAERQAGSGEQRPSPLSPSADHPAAAEAEVFIPYRDLGARKEERIRLEGVPALGIVQVGGKSWTAKVLDLSRGGVCLVVDQVDLPESTPARLHVPLAPGGELPLHRIYSLPLSEGKRRVGCSFNPPD